MEFRVNLVVRQINYMGLSKHRNNNASVKCFPTYVRHLPKGDEVGKFLALDLGGTNFRVLLIDIQLGKKFIMDSEVYAIDKEIMEGPGHILFDHIAGCLTHLVKNRNLEDETRKLPLGFTFRWVVVQL